MINFNHEFKRKAYIANNSNAEKVAFSRLYVFPKRFISKKVIFECFFDSVNRLDADLAKTYHLNPDDYMKFAVRDEDDNFLSTMVCSAEVGDELFDLEEDEYLRVSGNVLGVADAPDKRDPVIMVSKIEVLDKKTDEYEDEEENDFNYPEDMILPDDYNIIDDENII